MKHLFDTDELEAAIFSPEETSAEEAAGQEDGETILNADDIVFGGISETDPEDFPALELELTLTDGRSLTYELMGVFVHEEKEYAALHPKTDTEGEVHLMQLLQGEEDEIRLLPIEDDEELAAAADVFYRLFAEEDTADGAGSVI